MNRWAMYIVLAIVALAVLLVLGDKLLRPEVHLSENQARTLAEQELNFRYPNASVRIYEVTNQTDTNQADYWTIRAEVSERKHTTCPTLTLVELHYPAFGFVPRERQITANCEALGCKGNPTCSIAYEEEAILIAQEPLRLSPALQTFLSSNTNVSAAASFHPSYFDSHANTTYSDVWVVDWTGENNRLVTVLNKSGGQLLDAYPPE